MDCRQPPPTAHFGLGLGARAGSRTPGDRSKFYFRFGGVLIAQPGGGESGLHRARRARTHHGIRICITTGGAPLREAGRPAPGSGWLRPPGCSRRHLAPFPFSHLGSVLNVNGSKPNTQDFCIRSRSEGLHFQVLREYLKSDSKARFTTNFEVEGGYSLLIWMLLSKFLQPWHKNIRKHGIVAITESQ